MIYLDTHNIIRSAILNETVDTFCLLKRHTLQSGPGHGHGPSKKHSAKNHYDG